MEAILRWLSGLVRTGGSDDDADLDRMLLIAARATSDQLELSVHLVKNSTTSQTSHELNSLWQFAICIGPRHDRPAL